ncbi:hypothetical protein PUN28_015624 [Cardiocondyla obscurior]|uniref:Uncharacterized protein n=1 Tax=Cardiocondyla obscurior TaxID=286306 RepID=A0AAW2EZ19_9HYME
MPERAAAGTPAATKIPSYKVHRAYTSSAHTRASPPSTCARTRVHGSVAGGGGGYSNSSAHSKNRVSRPRLVEKLQRLVSYATIDLARASALLPCQPGVAGC